MRFLFVLIHHWIASSLLLFVRGYEKNIDFLVNEREKKETHRMKFLLAHFNAANPQSVNIFLILECLKITADFSPHAHSTSSPLPYASGIFNLWFFIMSTDGLIFIVGKFCCIFILRGFLRRNFCCCRDDVWALRFLLLKFLILKIIWELNFLFAFY